MPLALKRHLVRHGPDICEFAATLARQRSFKMLLRALRQLYCHCSGHLSRLTRRGPFGEASHIDTEMTVDFATETTPRDSVTIIVIRPLPTTNSGV